MTNKKIPMRTCIGCRSEKEKSCLIRIVKEKSGEISLDTTGKKNGRGAYICKDISCVEKAKKHNALAHAFSQNVDTAVYDELIKELNNIGE